MRKYAALACLIVFLCGCPRGGDPVSPVVAPVTAAPSAEMQKIVEPVVEIKDLDLASLYSDLAGVIERDSEIIKTTETIRTAHSRSGQLMFQGTGMKGKYPGLAEKVDAAIAEAIGKENVSLTPDLRAKAVEVFKALSWACQ